MKLFTRPLARTMVLLFIASFTLVAQESLVPPELEKSIDRIFMGFDHINNPGAAVAVVQNGEIVFKKGYGSANLEYDIPVTPQTIFHVASVSKQFTVFALLLLAEEGKLSLDDPIQKYISEVPEFDHEITLRHLATHTSGMRDQWDLLNLAGWRWDDVITKEHILKMVAKQKDLNFTPGEKFMYCNTGFTLLAEVVARVSRKSFAEFTQERMFTPLGMTNSLFYDDHNKIVKNRAYSYYPTGAFGFQKSVLSYANVGATSLFTTVEDLSLWAMNFKTLKVGSAALVKQMNTLAVLNNGTTFGGAYGQFVGPYKGLQQIQHSGGDAGFRSYLGRFPEQDFAVSVVTNNGTANPGALALSVADLYLKDVYVDDPKTNAKNPKTITLSEATLKAFEGQYWDAKDSYSRTVLVKEGKLYYHRGNGNTSELAPLGKTSFAMLNTPAQVTVSFRTENGKNRITVTKEGSVVGTLDEYTPVKASEVAITPYLGDYTSEELRTTYTLVDKEGQLVATHPRSADIPFAPLKTDIFTSGGNIVEFTRNNNNKITGLKISTGRVKNLKFSKD